MKNHNIHNLHSNGSIDAYKINQKMKWTCLMVENHESTARSLQKLLKNYGINCDICFHSKDFIKILEQKDNYYDALLIDYCLGNNNLAGVDLIKSIQKNKSIASRPIIFISNYKNPDTSIKVIQAGAADMVKKPIDEMELLELITRIKHVLSYSVNNNYEQNIITVGELKHNIYDKTFYIGNQQLDLSMCESAILCALFNKKGSICSRSYIERSIYNNKIMTKTKSGGNGNNEIARKKNTDVFICRIRKKINQLFKEEYPNKKHKSFEIITKWAQGYILSYKNNEYKSKSTESHNNFISGEYKSNIKKINTWSSSISKEANSHMNISFDL